jgi:hypothetical protein
VQNVYSLMYFIESLKGLIKISFEYVSKLRRYKRVFRRRKQTQDRQYNDRKKKEKRPNNDLQNTTQKTKGRATRTPPKI